MGWFLYEIISAWWLTTWSRGAVIAFTVKKPLLALPLAVLSHFVLDSIPHFGDNNQGVSKEGYFPRFKKAVLITDAALTVIFY